MHLRRIDAFAHQGAGDSIRAAAEQHEALGCYAGLKLEDDMCHYIIISARDDCQELLDTLERLVSGENPGRITVQDLAATIPPAPEPEQEEQTLYGGASRDELLTAVTQGARINLSFVLLAILSTAVAAIGLLKDDVAAVIGAMVIAPLLGPNLAIAFGAAVGDPKLIGRAAASGLLGLGIAIVMSAGIGLLWGADWTSNELHARTVVGLSSVVLALASGAAAVLSLISRLAMNLVGVMVAVALMPPAVTVGLGLGTGHLANAGEAMLLLLVNLACVNLAAQLVFTARGISARTWWQQQNARKAVRINLVGWFIALAILIAILLMHK
ncbi:MAG: TIGR00341 family protein [Acetobacteraceae bacterium]